MLREDQKEGRGKKEVDAKIGETKETAQSGRVEIRGQRDIMEVRLPGRMLKPTITTRVDRRVENLEAKTAPGARKASSGWRMAKAPNLVEDMEAKEISGGMRTKT